ncbi:hypothetical protein ACKWTF_014374 [Chironomus riparius]
MNQELKFQLKLTNFCGFFKVQSQKARKVLKIVHFGVILMMIYCIVTFWIFIVRNYGNMIKVYESVTASVTNTLALTKYLFLIVYSKEIFNFINEVQDINKNCE